MRLLGLATRTSPGPGVRSSTTWLLAAKEKTLARTLLCRAGKLGQARTLYTPGIKSSSRKFLPSYGKNIPKPISPKRFLLGAQED